MDERYALDWESDDVRRSLTSAVPKFVVVQPPEVDSLMYVFSGGLQHVVGLDEVRQRYPNVSFLGAGTVRLSKVLWGSDTCKKEFGYDKPSEELASRLEAYYQQQLMRVIGEIMSQVD